jgi:basic amino acid/polyamine antiporter, APA family
VSDSQQFQKRLGLFDGTMLVAGSMIGSGVYITSASIARDTGAAGWLLAAWAVAGVMTVLGALSYAELAAMMPHAGGQYVYLREAYSPLWGFLYGWTSFTVIQTGTIAAVGVAFAKFLGVLIPVLGTGDDAIFYHGGSFQGIDLPLPWLAQSIRCFEIKQFTVSYGQLIGVATVFLLTFWNTLGVQQGKLLQNVFTVTKIGSLLFVIAVAWLFAHNSATWQQNFADPWGGVAETKTFSETQKFAPAAGHLTIALMVFGGALVGSLFSCDAWNNVTFTAGEVRNPQRNLPLSLILGTGSVIGLYLLANAGYLGSLTTNEIATADNNRVATAMIEKWRPGLGVTAMAVAIMISTFGCNNGLILMGARLTYAMARDGLFFRSVGKLNKNSVPAVGLWLQAIWASVLTFSGTYDDLLDYVIFAALLFYALTVAGLFVLRLKRPDAERPYRALGYPVLPALYVLLCSAVMVDLLIVKPKLTWPGLILVILGVPVYLLWKLFGHSSAERPPVATGGH